MSTISRWLDKRLESLSISALTKEAAADLSKSVDKELGKEAVDHLNDILKSRSSFVVIRAAGDGDILSFVEKYVQSAEYRNATLSAQPSNFHRSLLQKSVAELSISIREVLSGLSVSDLSKAVKSKDWSRITGKEDADAKLSIDHTPHMAQFPVHPEYAKMLSEDHKHAPHKLEQNGISAEMVHSVEKYPQSKKSIFMAKPYHKKVESATKSWVKRPITGWATMATKALYNAGNIGHLAEDVSTHEHEGIPLTVHKFADDHKPIQDLARYYNNKFILPDSTDQVDLHKIGIMDYLSNNLDRHSGNLMVGEVQENGMRPLLAIDHERSFQYAKPISSKSVAPYRSDDYKATIRKETPWSYIKGSALNQALDRNGWHSHEDLVDWWSNNGQKIRDEMENQLGSVKDESVRNHIRDNFTSRWHKMNDWANKLKAEPDSVHMYHDSSLGEVFQSPHMSQPVTPRITKGMLNSLPKNKRDALFTIADVVNKKQKMTYSQITMLSSAMDNIIDKMTPEEAAEAFKGLVGNPYLQTKAIKNNPELDPKQKMLRHFWETKGFDKNHAPIYKYPHMQSMLRAIEDIPAKDRGMLESWADSYRRRLAEKEST
jgi:hypothetical protein